MAMSQVMADATLPRNVRVDQGFATPSESSAMCCVAPGRNRLSPSDNGGSWLGRSRRPQ